MSAGEIDRTAFSEHPLTVHFIPLPTFPITTVPDWRSSGVYRRKFRGGYRNPQNVPGSTEAAVMLSGLQHVVEGFFESSAGLFKKAGLSPNSITVLGFVLTVATFLFYSRGLRVGWEQAAAIITLLVASYFDALDGAMARRYRLVSKLGGILDSILDRLGELLLYSGLAIGSLVDFRVALWALSASFMVSYVRARAEADGLPMKGVGIAERPERLLILIVSTLFQPFYRDSLMWGTVLIAVLASLTALERVYRIRSYVSRDAD